MESVSNYTVNNCLSYIPFGIKILPNSIRVVRLVIHQQRVDLRCTQTRRGDGREVENYGDYSQLVYVRSNVLYCAYHLAYRCYQFKVVRLAIHQKD